MTTVITVTKNIIHRAWNDLEPKLIAFLATGLTASGLIWVADYVGFHLTSPEAALIVVLVSTIAGYIKASTTTVLPITPVPVGVILPTGPTPPGGIAAPFTVTPVEVVTATVTPIV